MIVVYIYFSAYVHLRFKDDVLGNVSEREEGLVALFMFLKNLIVVYIYFHIYIHLRFKHTVLGPQLGYLWCELVMFVSC